MTSEQGPQSAEGNNAGRRRFRWCTRISRGWLWTHENHSRTLRDTCAVVLLAALPGLAAATEGGATNKVLGVDTVLVGVIGPPGSLRLTTFLGYYHANELLDGPGNPRAGISNFDLNVSAFTVRLQMSGRTPSFGAPTSNPESAWRPMPT